MNCSRCSSSKYARQYNRSEPSISPSLLAAMERYHWPGNIRELESVVKRFVILQYEALRFDMETAGPRRSGRRLATVPTMFLRL
jgi:DNA-binding NtrC family response regulator